MRRRSIQSITRRTSRITSGPMPSPGSISSFLLAGIGVPVQALVGPPAPAGQAAVHGIQAPAASAESAS